MAGGAFLSRRLELFALGQKLSHFADGVVGGVTDRDETVDLHGGQDLPAPGILVHLKKNLPHLLLQVERQAGGNHHRGDSEGRRTVDHPDLLGVRRAGNPHVTQHQAVHRRSVHLLHGHHLHRFVVAVAEKIAGEEIVGADPFPGQVKERVESAAVGFGIDKGEGASPQIGKRFDGAVPMDDELGVVGRFSVHLGGHQQLHPEFLSVQHVRRGTDKGHINLFLLQEAVHFVVGGPVDHLALHLQALGHIIDDILVVTDGAHRGDHG